MRIYNYLFYKTYLLAQRSKNFDDMPALGGLIFVAACLMFNIFTVMLFLEGIGIIEGFTFEKKFKYIFSIALVLLLLIYYIYKDRYKKIVEYYEQKNNKTNQLHPIIVIILYYGASFGLGMLAAMFKNHDWIFAQ